MELEEKEIALVELIRVDSGSQGARWSEMELYEPDRTLLLLVPARSLQISVVSNATNQSANFQCSDDVANFHGIRNVGQQFNAVSL